MSNPVDYTLKTMTNQIKPMMPNIDSRGLLVLSTLSTVGAMYHLTKYDTMGFAIFAIIAYVFHIIKSNHADSVDSNMAFYKNILTFGSLAYILYTQYGITNYPILLVVLLTVYFLTLTYMGCQNIMQNDRYDDTLRSSCQDKLWYLRWFGIGSAIIVTICSVMYMNGELDLDSMYKSNIVPGTDDLQGRYTGYTGHAGHTSIFSKEPESLEFILSDIIGRHQQPKTRLGIEDFLRDPLTSSIGSFRSMGTECPSY